jgi:uncharacterized SAM-binding protein YcdF (DUF218 family)
MCLVGLVAWGAGLARFAAAIPGRVDDTYTTTDAIVVLTGGSKRIATGVSLLSAGMAEWVFVSGVDPTVDMEEVLAQSGSGPTGLTHRIEAGHGAVDTAGNAQETAEWMHRRGYHSLRLVTGNYHMPRSLFEFSRTLPDVMIVPHPVFPETIRRAHWWSPATSALIISEYNKFLIAWLRHSSEGLFVAGEPGS